MTDTSDKHYKICEIRGRGITIVQKYTADETEISLHGFGGTGKDAHEYHEVFVTIDGDRFTNPADGPYNELELQTDDGELADKKELVRKIAGANRITTESWDVENTKSVLTTRGKGFSEAQEFALEFSKTTE